MFHRLSSTSQRLLGAHRFRGILERVGISARNLYWCPNDLKEAEKDRFMMSFCMLRNAPKCSARQERKAFETKDDEKETKEKKEKKEKKESQESEGGYTPNTPMTSTSVAEQLECCQVWADSLYIT